jgi:hypothetical protein
MMFAFARDGGIPGHRFFNNVDKKSQTPVRTGVHFDLLASPQLTVIAMKSGSHAH